MILTFVLHLFRPGNSWTSKKIVTSLCIFLALANSNTNLEIIEETVERVYNYLMTLNSQRKGLQGLYISVTNGPLSFQPVSDANVQFETELQRTSAPIEGSANWLSLTR